MCDVGGLNCTDFKETGSAIANATQHGALAELVTKEVNKLGSHDCDAVACNCPAVSIPAFKELTLLRSVLLVKILEDGAHQFVAIGALVTS